MKNRVKRVVAVGMFALILSGGAIDHSIGVVHAAAVSAPSSVTLSPETWAYDTKSPGNALLVKNGVTYMSLTQLATVYSDLFWTVDKQGVLTITGPNHKLSWHPTSTTAYTNAGTLKMAVVPIKQKWQWFYPLKSLSDWAGGVITKYTSHEFGLTYTPLSIKAGAASSWYWVRKDNGIVYSSNGTDIPHNIGVSNVRAVQYSGMSITQLEPTGSVILNVMSSHGEPSLATDLYRLVIHNGKMVQQTMELYYGTHNTQSIDQTKEGYNVLLNGTQALFMDHKGNTVLKYDMASHLGKEKNFTIEYAAIDEGIALVRPYASGNVMLVDLKQRTAVTLYKELLSSDEQKLLEKWSTTDIDYPTDKLRLVKREGDVFIFEHRPLVGGTETSTLKYTWKRSETKKNTNLFP